MMYKHVLCLTVDPAQLVGFDRDASLVRARTRLAGRDDIDLRSAEPQVASSAIVVVVHLATAEFPGDQTIRLILSELGLPGTVRDVTSLEEPALAPQSAVRGNTRSSGPEELLPVPDKRYLRGDYSERVRPGGTFSLLVRIVITDTGGALIKKFEVPPRGRDVLLVLHAPGFDVLGPQEQMLHVPQREDSDPVRFELRATGAGVRPVSVTAWHGGTYLGQLQAEITVDPQEAAGRARTALADVSTTPVPGAVTLVATYEPVPKTYRFMFHDLDNPSEVTSQLAYEPGPYIERLIRDINELAEDGGGYSAEERRRYLVNTGADLWQTLFPETLREQFWARQGRIRQLTILTVNDIVPWELLYPLDEGHDAGFLVEQFPVIRGVFDRAPAPRLRIEPARFVVPEGSPPMAAEEVRRLRDLLGCGDSPETVISELTPLLRLLDEGDFGVLHFACHNTFDPEAGPAIMFGKKPFIPRFLTKAGTNKSLAQRESLVFVNACRSGGDVLSYNRLDGWAARFLAAGASAFIGSLWAVKDRTAANFADAVYGQLREGRTLGEAVTLARRAAVGRAGDPTWLAYSVYGNPRATVATG